MEISFKNLKVPGDLKATTFVSVDVRKDLGNIIYRNSADLGAFKLAEKIYDSGETCEISEQEKDLLLNIIKMPELGISIPVQEGIALALGIENYLERK